MLMVIVEKNELQPDGKWWILVVALFLSNGVEGTQRYRAD